MIERVGDERDLDDATELVAQPLHRVRGVQALRTNRDDLVVVELARCRGRETAHDLIRTIGRWREMEVDARNTRCDTNEVTGDAVAERSTDERRESLVVAAQCRDDGREQQPDRLRGCHQSGFGSGVHGASGYSESHRHRVALRKGVAPQDGTDHTGAVEPVPDRRFRWPVGAVAGAIGLITWIVTMASAPRYSYGADQDLGSPALWWVLMGCALIGGFAAPMSTLEVALGLGIPPLALSPFTTPRGDNDGLWVLIIPMLTVFVAVLFAIALAGAWLRRRVQHEAPS